MTGVIFLIFAGVIIFVWLMATFIMLMASRDRFGGLGRSQNMWIWHYWNGFIGIPIMNRRIQRYNEEGRG